MRFPLRGTRPPRKNSKLNIMNKKLLIATAGTLLLVAPFAAFAFSAGTTPINQGIDISGIIQIILDVLWIIFVGFAIVMFVLAGFQMLQAQGDPEGVGKARMSVIWGMVGVALGILAFSIPFFVRTQIGA